jgi:hydrogenase nickel incorporation protein HypA/HybF
MHELSVMSYLLEAVEEQARAAGAQRVLAINLLVGERTSFVDDSLLFYFDYLTPGRLCAGAQLHIRRAPMRFRCAACAQTFTPAAGDIHCPDCGALGQLTDDGRELLIESLEIET